MSIFETSTRKGDEEIDFDDESARERGRQFKVRLRTGFDALADKEGDWHGVPDVTEVLVTVKPPRNGKLWFAPTGAELASGTVDQFMDAWFCNRT